MLCCHHVFTGGPQAIAWCAIASTVHQGYALLAVCLFECEERGQRCHVAFFFVCEGRGQRCHVAFFVCLNNADDGHGA